jgi:acetate kinase
MRVLVVNTGTSVLRLTLLGPTDRVVEHEEVPVVPGQVPLEALQSFIRRTHLDGVDVVGHRVVHGSTQFPGPTLVDDLTAQRLRTLGPVAARCNPAALGALAVARAAMPDVAHVASFDTAFHTSMPPAAATYALPWEWSARFGLRRFGFHGLSHEWAAGQAARLLGRPVEGLRVVSAHLGATASVAAIDGGRAVDTTTGVEPLDGVVMGTRSGTVDASALLAVQQLGGMRPEDVEEALTRRSGLLGLSGLSGDLRDVEAAARAGFDRARLAIDVAVHRLRAAIAGMAAAIGGMDALVLTGRIGETNAELRSRVVAGLGFLGARLDAFENDRRSSTDRFVSTADSRAAVLVVRSREDLVIARQARHVVDQIGHG